MQKNRRSRMLSFGRTLVAGLLCIFVAVFPAFSDPKPGTYDALKAKYQTLRNTDPGIEREEEWRELASNFESLSKNPKEKSDSCASIFHAALLQQQLYEVLHDTSAASKAIELFDRVAEKFPTNTFADDSLLRVFEIQRSLGEFQRADDVLAQLKERYPKSELIAVALAKRNGSSGEVREQGASTEGNSRDIKGNRLIVVLDPGHGGEDFGAVGIGGLLEKDVTLSVAFAAAELLRKELGAIAKLTRESDLFVPLADRTAFANDSNADIFISIHTNASDAAHAGKNAGLESYILDNSNDQSSKLLAERENASASTQGLPSDLGFMLSDLVETSKLGESKALAERVQRGIIRHVSADYSTLKDLGVKKAPFYVLVGAHMPSVLVEMSFIDHAIEGRRLAEKQYRQAVALGIVEGIRAYAKGKRGLG